MSTIQEVRLFHKADAIQIYNDTYGRGHGREMTVSKFISVFGLNVTEANKLFDDMCRRGDNV